MIMNIVFYATQADIKKYPVLEHFTDGNKLNYDNIIQTSDYNTISLILEQLMNCIELIDKQKSIMDSAEYNNLKTVFSAILIILP